MKTPLNHSQTDNNSISNKSNAIDQDDNSNNSQNSQISLDTAKINIDVDYYLREIFTLGINSVKKLAATSVIISGMGGLGVEIAKSIILLGIGNVTIHDTRKANIRDLASNFYLTENSIGKNRAQEVFSSLSKLNPYVKVQLNTENLTTSLVQKYQNVIITDYDSESEIKEISTFCHQNNIKFILTETCGVFGYIFNDFGSSFHISNPTGKRPSKFLVEYVSNEENGMVRTWKNSPHNLKDGDHVMFEDIKGMTELNGKEFEVKVIDDFKFTIGDTSKFGQYTVYQESDQGTQIFLPQTIHFLEFNEALIKKEKMKQIACSSFQSEQVILAFLSIHHHNEKSDTTEISYEELFQRANEVNSIYNLVDKIDTELIREFSRESGAVISPTCSILGGIASFEIVKSIIGICTPIDQFMTIGYTASLPDDREYELKNDRYDPYRIVFGNKQQDVMQSLRYFMIGCNSIGCESIKNMALMGVGTKNDGKIVITDIKPVKKFNLASHFLCKEEDIGKMKNDVISHAIHQINPSIRIESKNDKLTESAKIFNDAFYENIDGIFISLDNPKVRIISEEKSIFYTKPLLESGINGTKCKSKVSVPYITSPCDSSNELDADYKREFDLSTINLFAFDTYTSYEFAKMIFDEYFTYEFPPNLCDQNCIESMKKNQLQDLKFELDRFKRCYVNEKCENFIECIKWARSIFESKFNFHIQNICQRYPKDQLDAFNGTPFWGGSKRYPTPISFDPNNKYHAQFITAAAKIKARIYGISIEKVDILKVAEKIQLDELNDKNNDYYDEKDVDSLINELTPALQYARDHKPRAEKIDVNDNSNNHLDFFEAATNIRAMNYNIKPASRLEIMEFACKDKPSFVPTTSILSGFQAFDVYKIHSINKKGLKYFNSIDIDLAINKFDFTNLDPPKIYELSANHFKFSNWDKVIFEGDLTVSEVIESAKSLFNMNVVIISIGMKIIYGFEEQNKNLNTKISELYKDLYKLPSLDEVHYIPIEIICNDENTEPIDDFPQIIVKIK